MTHASDIARIVCGICVFVSGLMLLGAFGWETPVAEPNARPFQLAMHEAGYFLPIITAMFLVTGMSFITNRYSAASAIALFPISINILLYHTILGAGQLPVAVAFFAINCFMVWYHRRAYEPLLKSRL